MKSTLFVALIALAVSYSVGVKIEASSCPTPYQPKFQYWHFQNFLGSWYVIARTDETVPTTVWSTININHLYPGKVAIYSEGVTRDIWVTSVWDKLVEYTVGDFNGKSYYDLDEQPFSFNITTSDGYKGTFWMPYYNHSHYAEAVFLSCVQVDEKTIDAKAWFVSKDQGAKPSDEVKDTVSSLIGHNLTEVCQGTFC